MAGFSHTPRLSSLFNKIADAIGRLVVRWREAESLDRYKPEKHYMRGPGPRNSGKTDGGAENPEAK